MAIPTPEYLVEWASNDDAENTKPGASLITSGWLDGDAPASSHYNYVLGSAANWTNFLASTLTGQFAWANIDFTVGEPLPFGDDSSHLSFIYSQVAGRWYALRKDASVSGLNIHESFDGDTWTGSLNFNLGETPSHSPYRRFSLPQVGNGVLSIAYSNAGGTQAFTQTSSDYTIANLGSKVTDPFENLVELADMVFDEDSREWFAVGNNGTTGYIEHAADPSLDSAVAGGWEQLNSYTTTDFTGIARNPYNGAMIATTTTTATKIASSSKLVDGFSTGPTLPEAAEHVMWCEALQCFIAHGASTGSMYLLNENATSAFDVGIDMGVYLEGPNFLLNVDPADESAVLVTRYVAGTNDIRTIDLGFFNIGKDFSWIGGGSVAIGGQGKIIFPWFPNEEKAIMYYGAQKERR